LSGNNHSNRFVEDAAQIVDSTTPADRVFITTLHVRAGRSYRLAFA
jgi:hypothetical protein